MTTTYATKKGYAYTDEQMAPTRFFRDFTEKNGKGETLTVEFIVSENCHKSYSLPRLWFKKGWTDHELETYWSVNTYAYSEDGSCRGLYNPTEKDEGTRHVIDFEWLFEATPENLEKLTEEIARRFYSAKES